MTNVLGDLRTLVEEATEAQRILGQKEDLLREIAKGEKQLAGVIAGRIEAEKSLQAARTELQETLNRHSHEKNRLTLDLQAFQRQCDEAKRVSSDALTAQQAAARKEYDSYRAKLDDERRYLEAQVASLCKQHEAYTRLAQTFLKKAKDLVQESSDAVASK